MDKTYKINKDYDFRELAKMHLEGYQLVCHICEAKLLVALNLEEAAKLKIAPGIYCPTDGKHIYIHIYLREMRDKMRDALRVNRKQDNE